MAAFPTTVEELEKFMEVNYGLTKKAAVVEKKEAAPKSPPKKKMSDMNDDEKRALFEHNISLWNGKLEKSTDDEEKNKLQEKIDAENKKLAKLAAGGAPKEKKPAAKKKAEPKGEGEKRVTKMTPTYSKYLKEISEKVGLTYNDDNKKELGHELINYINGLTDEDFKSKGLKDHITEFVTTKKATTVVEEDDEEDESETEEAPAPTSNVAGGGPSDLPEILTLDELQKIKLTATLPGKPGTFMNTATGKFVTGPEADEDEDSTEIKFNGKEYAVGDKTGRVYECREEGDFFAGFVGVGQFKEMKV
jgi:hypothetical protein